MSVTVTLHVFSGRPDPAWELTDQQAQELADRIAAIDKQTMLKPPGIAGNLGYRGFSIQAVREKTLDPHIYVHAGVVDADRFAVNRLAGNSDLEAWLLSTAGSNVDSDVARYVEAELSNKLKAAGDDPSLLAAPPFDPGKWNNDPTIRSRNNCYNYANDKITNTFAQPGRGSGTMYSAIDGGNVGAAAQRDGQIPLASPSSTPAQGQYIALVIWPGQDYHWYRRDNNGMWSHKPGQTPARNTDQGGQLISNPQICNRGPYTVWCGYYHCIPASTRIG